MLVYLYIYSILVTDKYMCLKNGILIYNKHITIRLTFLTYIYIYIINLKRKLLY